MKAIHSPAPYDLSARHCRRAFSFAEVMVAVIILSVLMVAGLRLFGNLGRAQLTTLDADSANILALEIITEMKTKAYHDAAEPLHFGPEEIRTTRQRFDDVDDYNAWQACPPQDSQGNALSQFPGLTRAVQVRWVAAADFSQSSPVDEGFKEVTVTIKRGNRIVDEQKYIFPDASLD